MQRGVLHLKAFDARVPKGWTSFPVIEKKGGVLRCWRCSCMKRSAIVYVKQARQQPYYYCRECVMIGSARSTQKFIWRSLPKLKVAMVPLREVSILTEKQRQISSEVVETLRLKQSFHYVWAVTGAGKTAMLFAAMQQVIAQGQYVAFVSPRREACKAVSEQVTQVFTTVPHVVLHQKSGAVYQGEQLVIGTVQQLLRFHRSFKLLIVDEADAFPYSRNESLHYGVKQALTSDGLLVYLSATPSAKRQKQLRRGCYRSSELHRRYHGKDMLVPREVLVLNWYEKIATGRLPQKVSRWLTRVVSERQTLIFVPEIKQVDLVVSAVQAQLSVRVAGVSAKNGQREQHISAFKEGEITVLVTTLVLERGVNFPNVNVAIIGAEHRQFNRATLLQISGRVGRNPLYQEGEIVFFHGGMTKALRQALATVKHLNREV
ncbi:helicase-related protein [Brochothrix campestris]